MHLNYARNSQFQGIRNEKGQHIFNEINIPATPNHATTTSWASFSLTYNDVFSIVPPRESKFLSIQLQEETGLPVMVAKDPLSAVAKGAGMALNEVELLKGVSMQV
ncbi:MAG: hypothetical protein CSYNP_00267 [Syntrophus sp. SKADARSKE-3]|nr:hypothetical protein [Syntrophus sp. SKADARSKE-3]